MPEAIERARDEYQPQASWKFDAGVTAVFDDMLERSIPQYAVMREACFTVGSRLVQPGTAIIDLGCSRGEAMARFVDRFGAHNRFVGVEVSEPMLEACRERFKGLEQCGIVSVRNVDLRKAYPAERASLTLAVLTIQFTPIEYRQQIFRQIYEHTVPGGGAIVVEKVIGGSAHIDDLLVAEYLDMKRANGYTEDQIQRKRMSLEGVLVPVTAQWNVEMLHKAGFPEVECIWRWMNFAAWIAKR